MNPEESYRRKRRGRSQSTSAADRGLCPYDGPREHIVRGV